MLHNTAWQIYVKSSFLLSPMSSNRLGFVSSYFISCTTLLKLNVIQLCAHIFICILNELASTFVQISAGFIHLYFGHHGFNLFRVSMVLWVAQNMVDWMYRKTRKKTEMKSRGAVVVR